MLRKNRLALAVSAAAGISAGVAMPQLANAQEEQMVEEVVVTGSRIKRSSFAEGSQVVSLDEVQIEAMGTLTIADVLRSSPLNSLGSFNERSGSSAQSNATVDLRGLGSERTLVMIDGRRLAGSPNLGASAININMLPMAAVERIDILADGASAVYGSDAVAGVVNLVMKENFEGIEFQAVYGDRDRDDGIEEGLSMVAGLSNDRGNIMIAAEYNRRDPIFDGDRDYTAARADDLDGDGRISAYLETDGISYYGRTIELFDPNTGYNVISAATNCDELTATVPGFVGEMGAEVFGYAPPNSFCSYAYADVSANKAELNRYNTYMSANYEINDKVEFYSRGIFSRVKSFGRYAPPAAPWIDMPKDNPDVPFDMEGLLADGTITEDAILYGYYRWTDVGFRSNEVTDYQYDFTAGLRGDINDRFSYDAYAQYDRYESKEFGYYYLSNLGRDYVFENGINPTSPEGLTALRSVPTQDNETVLQKIYGHGQYDFGDVFGSGPLMVLAGAEYFEMDYKNKYDAHSEGGYVGGSAGNSAFGERDVTAFFAEAVIPVFDEMEFNVAVRYDDYSDFGSETSPTIAWTWGALDSLTLRARWGQGFRAPGLDQLYGATTFSASDATDYLSCQQQGISNEDCPETQYDTYFSANDGLDAETSESLSAGVNWQFFNNWALDVGYWDVEVENTIRQESTQSIMYAEAAGIDTSAVSEDTYVDRSLGRPVVYSSYTNAGTLNVNGVDLKLNGVIETGFGMFDLAALWSHQLEYSSTAYYLGPEQDTAGFNLTPEDRAQAMMIWTLGNHQVDVVWNYIGGHSEGDSVEISDNGSAKLTTSSKDLDSWETWDAAYSYDAQSWGRIKLGVRNLTDEDPVFDSEGKFPRDHYGLYDNTGRVYYAEYKISF